ncbi:restriction endonuclease subunit S [Methylovorus mays]|uniref:restriction endonuclease subunit S n=1 Tax=Methylovorus mays TaxID=184077 RepID=UPI001E355BFC|nr:restriction endonuclease subunit S [Methylovorus mays]MCB5208003.1 restriction endonuclease subunit S [Methylovorus mays]
MSEWLETYFGDYINVINGYAFKSSNFLDAGTSETLPIIKIKNVANGNVHLNGAQHHIFDASLSKYLVENKDVLIALTGNHPQAESQVVGIASRYKLNEKALLNQRVAKIVTKDESLLAQDFIYYFLIDKNTHQYLASQSSGSANQANISKTDIEQIPISLPCPEEQKAIASVLSSLDDKIDLLHRQNTTLERMAETLFRQWFVEEVQEDWEDGTLGEVVEIFDNMRIPLSKMERDKKKGGVLYPYYGAAQIMDYINDYIFDGEYILMGEDGTVRTDEGFPVLQYATGKFWVNNHTHVLKAKPPYSNFLIWNYLSKKNIDEIVTGAVQPKINQGNLKALDFPKLPEHLVVEFNSLTKPMLIKINNNKKQIQTLEKLRDNLLPKLMSGEVRVNS